MTYSISLTGHGASADDAKDVFADTVRALRQINSEAGTSAMVSGSISGSAGDGTPFSMQAAEVQSLEAADVTEDDDDNPDSGSDG